MAAALRLPKSTTAEERDNAVEGLIRKLGLTKVRPPCFWLCRCTPWPAQASTVSA